MLATIVIRTYNEQRYLPELLAAIAAQEGSLPSGEELHAETIVVDSGSTDPTVEIARAGGARVVHIPPERFSFGRSLNLGCAAAAGEVLIFISGHCVPCRPDWLRTLVVPIATGTVTLVYGRQVGGPATKLSEHQVFAKLYPEQSAVPQEGFFCNNANAALLRSAWHEHRFDEDLLGLEDMDLGKRLLAHGQKIGYVAEAPVYHYHHESWAQIRRRYEREAIALRRIRPEWHLTFAELVRYLAASVLLDSSRALSERRLLRSAGGIMLFRLMQYWGSYRGNHEHRRVAEQEKRRYFYPK